MAGISPRENSGRVEIARPSLAPQRQAANLPNRCRYFHQCLNFAVMNRYIDENSGSQPAPRPKPSSSQPNFPRNASHIALCWYPQDSCFHNLQAGKSFCCFDLHFCVPSRSCVTSSHQIMCDMRIQTSPGLYQASIAKQYNKETDKTALKPSSANKVMSKIIEQ